MADDANRLLAEAARAREEMRAFEASSLLERAAESLRKAGRNAEAIGVWRQLADLQPVRSTVYRIAIGEALGAEGQIGEALALFDEFARELRREDRHEEIADVREAAARVDPDVRRVVAFARAAVTARQPGRPLAALQRAYRDDPSRLDVLELLCWAFASTGAAEKAAATRTELRDRYGKALAAGARAADPESDRESTRTRINQVLRYERPYRGPALDLAEEMAERNPLAPDARRTLATVRAAFGDLEGAANEFLAAAEIARAAGDRDLAEEILHEGRNVTNVHALLK